MRRKLALVLIGLCAALVAMELVLQVGAWIQWQRLQAASTTGAGTGAPGETVLCVGDSFTYGLGATDPANAYPAAAERELRAIEPSSTLRFVNAGWAGSDSEAVLARLPQQLAVNRPRLVYVLVGYNDFWSERRVDPADAQAFPIELRTLRLLSLIVAWLRGGPTDETPPSSGPGTPVEDRNLAPFLGPWNRDGVWVEFRPDGRVETSNGELPALWSHDARQIHLDDRETKRRTSIDWRLTDGLLAVQGGPFPQGFVLERGLPERSTLERGRALRRRGDLGNAERELRTALDDPSLALDARLELAGVLADTGRAAEAAPILEPVRSAFDAGTDAALGRRLADALLAAARRDEATAVLERLLLELPIDDVLVQQLARVGLRTETRALDAAVEKALQREGLSKTQRIGLLGLRPVLNGEDEAITLRCLVEVARFAGDDSAFTRTVVWNRARFTREGFVQAVDAAGLVGDERERVIAAFDAAHAQPDLTGEGLAGNLARIVDVCRAAGAEPVLMDYPLDRPSIAQAADEVANLRGVARVRLGEEFRTLVAGSRREDWYIADGHCNDRGYAAMGRIVARDVAARIRR
jgi:lysophospholipase L1-like esterase